MCEIITILASVGFSIAYCVQKKNGKNAKSLLLGTLMFWGASLMWLVDCIFSAASGGDFFDISVEDTVLGIIILGFGFAVFAISLLREKMLSQKA